MRNVRSLSGKTSRFEVRFAGSGGQGVLLAGIILAEAAVLEGNNASQSQTYGPEARGGSSRSDVVLSNGEIDYPWSQELDVLVALTQQGYDENAGYLKEDGLAIIDPDMVTSTLSGKSISVRCRHVARDLGEERAVNMAALGAIAAFCPYVSRQSLAKVISGRLPANKVDTSLKAFEIAFNAASGTAVDIKASKEEIEI